MYIKEVWGSNMQYIVIRSSRKTVSLQIKNGELTVRAPFFMSDAEIEQFVLSHEDWINKHFEAARHRENKLGAIAPLEENEIRELAKKALEIIPRRVEYYAPIIGVTYGRITIRNQHTRWGSCSGKGNLSFNCLLMLAPLEVVDSVVVHELCHIKQMNHSKLFYDEVKRVFPEYFKWHSWLKEHGEALMAMNIKNKDT